MTTNRLVLSGTVFLEPVQKVSPSGITHCQFVLEHRSEQKEAGFNRLAWCRMPVVASGQLSVTLTKKLIVGSKVMIQGFVSCHQGRNGLRRLVLHAERIKLIDSGD